MSRRLSGLLTRFLLVLFLADIVGAGAIGTSAAIDDQHGPVAAQSGAADGVHKDDAASSGCNHACHFAQHLFAPISESPVPVADASSYAIPVHRAGAPIGVRQKASFPPPRTLA